MSDALASAARSPAHAYLLAGPGGEAAARWLAAELLGVPQERLEAEPDFHQLEREGVTYRVEQVEQLWSLVHQRPFAASRTVILLPEAEAMPELVQNALLKSIEEPPAHVVVLLASERPQRLLPTVRSRLVRLAAPLGEQAVVDDGREARRRERVDIARAALRGGDFDASAAAATLRRHIEARGKDDRAHAQATADRQLARLGDVLTRGERSRLTKLGEDRAKRAQRRGEMAEAHAAVSDLAACWRDVVAASLGAQDALLHSHRRDESVADAGDELAPVAARALVAAADTLHALDTLTLTPSLALEGLLHRTRVLTAR